MIDDNLIESWVALGCLAPSPHNNQPWAATVEGGALIVRLEKRYLPLLGPDRLQFMALGAFIENVATAAGDDGYSTALEQLPVAPDRDVKVALSFSVAAAASGGGISKAARLRRTNRGPYASELADGVLDQLRAVVVEDGTGLVLVEEAGGRELASALAGRAMEVVFTLPDLREDLAPYVFSAADREVDVGMPLASMNPTAAAQDVAGHTWAMELATAAEESAAARQRFLDAPLHFIVTARSDTLPCWVDAGRTLQRLLVVASGLGLSHCLAAGPSEIPTLLAQLRGLVPASAGRPMLLGRLGVPLDPRLSIASPRRSVADVLS